VSPSNEAGTSPITAMPDKSRVDQLHRKANALQIHSRELRAHSKALIDRAAEIRRLASASHKRPPTAT
jgi:hypothetical protein